MTPKDLKKLLVFSFKNNHPVLITGRPGSGKTDIVKSAAKKVAFELMIMHPVVDDPTDYKGLGAIVNDEAHFLPYGNLKKMKDTKKPLIVFFDDLGQATFAVQSALMQLILSRSINGVPISKYVVFVAATNRRQDKANVSGILEPVKSRFHSIVELEHTKIDDWIAWAIKKKMPKQLISFIEFMPKYILDEPKATLDIENSHSPRTIANVGKMMNNKLPKSLYYESFKGAAGKPFAIDFTNFLKVYETLPTLKQIKENPLNTIVPSEPSGKFALIGMIVEDLTKDNMGGYLQYLDRVGSEITTAVVRMATIKKPDECKNAAFINWVSKHNVNYGKAIAIRG